MATEGGSGEGYHFAIEQLKDRMDGADRQRQRAVELEAESSRKAGGLERENHEQRLQEMERLLTHKIECSESELGVRVEAIKEAGDKLAAERDRAAQQLRETQQKAMDQAEREKVAAAEILAAGLKQMIDSGDEGLRLHIQAQTQQLESTRREMGIINEASEKAIAKAEAANEKRFAGVNEFRQQLSDQAKEFMPRELAESQFADMHKEINLIRQGQSTSEGKSLGSATTIGYMIAAATLIIALVVVAVNILGSVL